MPIIEITQGESAGSVCEPSDIKAARMIAAGVAKLTDKTPPPEPKKATGNTTAANAAKAKEAASQKTDK